MGIPTRPVYTTLYNADGTPRANALFMLVLMQDGYGVGGTIPKGTLTATSDSLGVATIDAWPNAEGFTKTYYTYYLPDGSHGDIEVPEGSSPISLEEIRAMHDSPPPDPLEATAVWEVFRGMLSGRNGAALVGWAQSGDGVVTRNVLLKLQENLSLDDFYDTTADAPTWRAAFDAAVARVGVVGHGTIRMTPGRPYLIEGLDDLVIRVSHLTIDGQGATFYALEKCRIVVNGDPGVAGADPLVSDVHIRNLRIGGDEHSADNVMKGPQFYWVRDCTMSEVHTTGPTGTTYVRQICWRVNFTNCSTTSGQPIRGSFGFLNHMTWDCMTDNCIVFDAQRSVGFQQKGGDGNVYSSCTVRGITRGTLPNIRHAFWDRGDGPWKDSNTAFASVPWTNPTHPDKPTQDDPIRLTYPFADKSWDVSDVRRASIGTRWINGTVADAIEMNGWCCQEAIGSMIVNPMATTVKSGIVLQKNDASDDHIADASLDVAADTGATVLFLSDVGDARLFDRPPPGAHPVVVGSTAVLDLDSGSRFVTTLAAVPADTTGDTTLDSDILTNVADITGFVIGAMIAGEGIPDDATITLVTATTITMSAPAEATATGVTLTTNTLTIADALPSAAAAGKALFVPRGTVLTADASGSTIVVASLNLGGGNAVVGDLVTVIQDDDTLHTTTVDAINSGTKTLTLHDALPGTASKGHEVSRSIIGQEADFSVVGGRIEDTTARGLSITGQRTSYLAGVSVRGTRVKTTDAQAYYGEFLDRPTVHSLYITDPNDDNVAGTDGIRMVRCTRPIVTDNVVEDTRGRMAYGIRLSSGVGLEVTDPIMHNNIVTGSWVTAPIQSWQPGSYYGNKPGSGYVVTTDNVAATNAWRCYLSVGQCVRVLLTIVAQQASSANQALYVRGGLFYGTSDGAGGVTVTQVSGTVAGTSPDYSNESNAGWNAQLTTPVGGGYVGLSLLGATGATITWVVGAELTLVG